MAEANDVVMHGMVLRRPFKLEQIVAVLNAAGAATADAGQVEAFADDFYTRDLENDGTPAGSSDSDDLWTRREHQPTNSRSGASEPAKDLDFMIHGDPLVEPEVPKPLIQADTTVGPGGSAPTKRSEGRAEQSRHRVIPTGIAGVDHIDPSPIVLPPRNEQGAPLSGSPVRTDSGESGGYRLSEYLAGELIASPTLLQLPDLPALILDPKKRVYHAVGYLSALEPYASRALPRSALHGVSTSELARAREEQAARTYDELNWLLALLKGGGRLAPRLDPGGTYQVTRPVKIDPAYHAHGKIAQALAAPARLHEITAASGASMEQVFDVVGAYDAIGRLSWTPRQRLASTPESKPTPPKSRFWPFGKR
jgi:hypothetical protein